MEGVGPGQHVECSCVFFICAGRVLCVCVCVSASADFELGNGDGLGRLMVLDIYFKPFNVLVCILG